MKVQLMALLRFLKLKKEKKIAKKKAAFKITYQPLISFFVASVALILGNLSFLRIFSKIWKI